MNIIDKIRVALALNKSYERFKREAKMGEKNEIKSGYKTTEFWLTVLSEVGTLVGALSGVIPPDIATIIIAVQTAVYSILRTIGKK